MCVQELIFQLRKLTFDDEVLVLTVYCQPSKTFVDCKTSLEAQLGHSHHREQAVGCLNAFYSNGSPSVGRNYSTVEEVDQLHNEKTNFHHKASGHSHRNHSVLRSPLLFVVSEGHSGALLCMSDRKLQETKGQAVVRVTRCFVSPYLPTRT